MAATNVPVNPPVLTFGTPHLIGRVAVTADTLSFKIPCESIKYRGNLVVQQVPVGGTMTALTASLQLSLDGGVTYQQFVAAADLVAGIQKYDVSGAGGTQAKLVFTITLGTATAADIWVNVG